MAAAKPERTDAVVARIQGSADRALELAGRLDLKHQLLLSISIDDEVADLDRGLRLVHQPPRVQRQPGSNQFRLRYEMELHLQDAEEDEDEFWDSDDAPDELASIGTLTYTQLWEAEEGVLRVDEDEQALTFFAVSMGRSFVENRVRDLLATLSAHLGRPVLLIEEPATPWRAHTALINQLAEVIGFIKKQ